MNASTRCGAIAVLCASLAVFGLAGVRAESAPQPRELGKQVMPERIFQEIVNESTRFIQVPVAQEKTKPRPALPAACNVSITSARTIRANALLIALAAQNRILSVGTGPDAAKLATVRDAAVKLAVVVAKNPMDNPDLLAQIAIFSQYPDIKADPNVSLALVRFKGTTFTHDDIASVFSGCGGNKTQLIEQHMLKLLQPKALFAPGNVVKLELLAYKVALLADVIRDMDDMIPTSDMKVVEHRQEWVRFASEVHQEGWQLAETVRGGNVADMRQGLTKLDKACAACHDKFRR